MVTGIEAAGLALAIFPLIVQGVGCYLDGIGTIKEARNHRGTLKRLLRRLQVEQFKFEDTCGPFIEGLHNSERAMNLLKGVGWEKPEFRTVLEERLQPNEVELFISAVEAFAEHLEELRIGLGLGKDHKPLENFQRSQWEKFKLVLEKKSYEASLEEIRRINEDLAHLMAPRSRPHVKKPVQQSEAAKNYNLTRDRAQSLYKVLQERFKVASCHRRHNASLQLERETLLEQGEVRFKVLFNFDFGPVPPTTPVDSRSWCSLEFRSADVEETTSALNPDENEDQPGREKPVDSARPSSTTKQKSKMFKEGIDSVKSVFGKKGKRKVAFQRPCQREDSQAEVQQRSLPKVAETLQRVNEICTAAKEAASCSARCMGFVADDEKGFRYRIWPPKKVPSRFCLPEPISLEALLFPGSIEERDRLELGVKLASAVMQLHTTQWLKESWGVKDIFFLQKKPMRYKTRTGAIVEISEPELEMPFVRGAEQQEVHPLGQTDETPGMPALTEYDKSLFSLGIVLIELYFERPLQDLPADRNQGQGEEADFQTAQQHIGDLFRRAGPNYGLAVSYCINGGKLGAGFAKASNYILDDVNFKNAVHDNVVCLLQENLKVFSTAYGED